MGAKLCTKFSTSRFWWIFKALGTYFVSYPLWPTDAWAQTLPRLRHLEISTAPRSCANDRLIVLLSAITDWLYCEARPDTTQPDSSSYPLWPTDRTAIRYGRLIVLLPDPTQHNRYPRLLYYTFFWTETEVPQAQIDHVHIPREALELINLFISLELIPNKFRWNLVDIMCFQNFEHFQMNFVQSFAPIIHGMHMPNDSSSWSSCCEVCRKVILDVKMYRFSYEIFKVDFLKY